MVAAGIQQSGTLPERQVKTLLHQALFEHQDCLVKLGISLQLGLKDADLKFDPLHNGLSALQREVHRNLIFVSGLFAVQERVKTGFSIPRHKDCKACSFFSYVIRALLASAEAILSIAAGHIPHIRLHGPGRSQSNCRDAWVPACLGATTIAKTHCGR